MKFGSASFGMKPYVGINSIYLSTLSLTIFGLVTMLMVESPTDPRTMVDCPPL
jgi:hypothetical protein